MSNHRVFSILLSSGMREGRKWGMLRDLLHNPLVVVLGSALAFRLIGLPLPELVNATLMLLSRMSAPAALLVVGGTLALLRPTQQLGGVALIVAGKLILHPAATLAAFLLCGGVEEEFVKAAVVFAAMPMVSVYPILCQRAGLNAVAATALLAATCWAC